jgi:hypothetical protein
MRLASVTSREQESLVGTLAGILLNGKTLHFSDSKQAHWKTPNVVLLIREGIVRAYRDGCGCAWPSILF